MATTVEHQVGDLLLGTLSMPTLVTTTSTSNTTSSSTALHHHHHHQSNDPSESVSFTTATSNTITHANNTNSTNTHTNGSPHHPFSSSSTASSGISGMGAGVSGAGVLSTGSASAALTVGGGGGGGGLLSIPGRVIRWVISTLLWMCAKLPDNVRPWFWVGLWLFFVGIGIGILAGFHTRIFQLLESMAMVIKGLGRAGPPMIMAALFLTAFPPVFGYSSLVTMAGYVYGFAFGFFIVYTSALLGAVTCFYLCRRRFKVQVRALMAKKQSMKSIVKAVEKRGFKLLLLIRLAPYPFNVTNALLSATHIPLSTFTLATAISLLKLALHVYIGSTLSSLAPAIPPPVNDDGSGGTKDPSLPPLPPVPAPPTDEHGRTLKIVVMVFSVLLGIAVGGYVWIVAKREIEASEGIRSERRRKRRASVRQMTHNRNSSIAHSSGATPTPGGPGRGLVRTASGGAISPGFSGGSNGVFKGGDIDLTNSSTHFFHSRSMSAGGGSDFVGGGGGGSMAPYQDDDDAQEDQAFFHHSHPSNSNHHIRGSPHSREGSGSESDGTDFLDDDDDDDDDDEDLSDMERGVDDYDDHDDSLNNHSAANLLGNHRSTLSSPSSWNHGSEMDVRQQSHPHKVHKSSPSSGSLVEQESMGWFAQNGVDISDRGW